MKSGKSRIVGVLVRNNARAQCQEKMAHPLLYAMLLGINAGLQEAGYMMSLARLSTLAPNLHAQNSAFQGICLMV
jgi:DNA-binding LacI/PurR family transcriptional regulator